MKGTVAIIAVAAAVLIVAGLAYAQMGGGWGPGAGCNYGMGYNGNNGTVNVENLKKFQKETLGMRDELIANRAELANEYAKPAPDATRVADLRKQMIDNQTKIQKAAEKYGLPAWRQGYGHGSMGRGMMTVSGNGCPRWQ
jgi:zinc resistance-associated protein